MFRTESQEESPVDMIRVSYLKYLAINNTFFWNGFTNNNYFDYS